MLALGAFTRDADAFLLHRGGVAAPSSGALSLPQSLNNLDASNSYVAPKVSYGVAFAEGDIPLGGSATVTDSNGNPVTVQQDQVVTNPATGLIRFARLSHPCSETFGPSSSKGYTIGASATAPNTAINSAWLASGSAEATLAANTNFNLQFSGFDAGVNTYQLSVNTILSSFSQGPNYGTSYPQGGWVRTAQGPNCIDWQFWGYIVNSSSGKTQGYVRADIFLKAWSPTGPFEAYVMVHQPNMWNTVPPNSGAEMYNQNPGRFATLCTLYNGATPVAYFGGSNEYRAQTVANSSFNTANNTLTMTAALWRKNFGGAVVFSSTGAVPTGLSATTLYWPTEVGGVDANNPVLATNRTAASQAVGSSSAWVANTAYGVGVKRLNNNVLYYCTTAGTSASSGGPTGVGAGIVDGTCQWTNFTVPFSDQGSGTITMYSVNSCYPATGWVGGDINGDPVWIGSGSRPRISAGEDLTYLTTKTKSTPPYGLDAATVTATATPWVYNPMYPATGYFAISTSGDNAGDQRIGPINEDAVNTFYNPADPYYYNSSLQAGLAWVNYPTQFYDERSGYPTTFNNGPAKSGTSYTSMASPQPNWDCFNASAGGFGVGNWVPWSTAFNDQNGFVNGNPSGSSGNYSSVPGSHMPAIWYGPYLKTGAMPLHDIGVSQGNYAAAFYVSPNTEHGNQAISGTTYYRIISPGQYTSTQERSFGWCLRILTNARWLIRDANPCSPYLNDICADNAFAQNYYYANTQPSQAATFGMLSIADHTTPPSGHGTISPFQIAFCHISIGMEAWRNTDSGIWKTWLSNYLINFWALYSGTGVYAMGTYTTSICSTQQNFSTCYQTQSAVNTATYNDNENGGTFPAPNPTQPYIYSFNNAGNYNPTNYPADCNDYPNVMRMALTVACTALPTNATLAAQLTAMNSTFESLSGQSTQGGCTWSGAGNNHKTFCCYKAAA